MASKIIGIKIDDHSAEVLKALHDEMIPKALKAVGVEVEGYAKKDCPVDTGRLRNSISWATRNENDGKDKDSSPKATPEKNFVYVGTNVAYAAKQEFGDYHHKVGKKHYLRDAAANHSEHYKAILEAALRAQ